MKDSGEEGKTNSLGAGNDEDEGGEGGDAGDVTLVWTGGHVAERLQSSLRAVVTDVAVEYRG